MTPVYEIGLDKNGDGFICMDAKPGDALNMLPHAIRYTPLGWHSFGTASAVLVDHETAYGLRYFQLFLPGAALAGFDLGRSPDGTNINTIPVNPSQEYTAVVWARGSEDYSGETLNFKVHDHVHNMLATSVTVGPGVDWTRYTITFTTLSGSTHVYIRWEKPSTSPAMLIDAAGYMLVEGANAPDGFNTGAETDLNDFITPDVVKVRWRLGMKHPYDAVSWPAAGEIIVTNNDGQYSPELASINLDPGTPVRVRVTHENETFILFTGRIEYVQPDAGDLAGRFARLHLAGVEQRLADVRVSPILFVNEQAKIILEHVVNHPGLSNINRYFDEGVSTFAYAGDTWGAGISAAGIVRQIVEAERGRFFSGRDGHLYFYDRDRVVPEAAAVFTDQFEALEYTYGEYLKNLVRVNIRPRTVGEAGSTIWTAAQSQTVQPGKQIITAVLRDEYGNLMGATAIISPVANTDYTFNTSADGTGTDVTGDVSISLVSANGSAVILEVENTTGAKAYLQPGSKIRGTPLIQGDPLAIEAADMESIIRRGLRLLEYHMPYFVNVEEAAELANAELNRRKDASGLVRALSLSSRVRLGDALRLTLFDVVTVQEGRTGHNADYFIIAEAHEIDQGGERHRVTWTMESV